jgi:hypothetical protein
MEHLEHPEEALQSIRRVASKYVILSVPREPLWSIMNMARGNTWDPSETRRAISNAGAKRRILRLIGRYSKFWRSLDRGPGQSSGLKSAELPLFARNLERTRVRPTGEPPPRGRFDRESPEGKFSRPNV